MKLSESKREKELITKPEITNKILHKNLEKTTIILVGTKIFLNDLRLQIRKFSIDTKFTRRFNKQKTGNENL